MPLETVFKIVNEDSREIVENPALRALEQGVIVGLANHTVLIAKDGRETSIDDSAAPIRDISGKVIGAVLVFRDITERRKADREAAEHVRLTNLRADVSTALANEDSLRSALQKTCEALVKHLDASFARIWTKDEYEPMLDLQASAGMYTHLDGADGHVAVGEFKIGRIAESKEADLTNDVANDPNIGDPEWAKSEGMKAFAGYPLLVGGHVKGVLAIFSKREIAQPTLDDLRPMADSIAEFVNRRQAEDAVRASEARNAAMLMSA